MTDDVRLAASFPGHRKTRRLKKRLGAEGVLSLIYLWSWAGSNRWSGDLAGMTDEDIEDEAHWEGEPGALVKALVAVKYLDGVEGARALHDWVEHNPYAASKGARIARGKKGAAARWNKAQGELPLDASSIPENASSIENDAGSNALGQCPPAPAPAPSPTESESGARAQAVATSTAEALQAAGCPDVHPYDPRLHQALADGITTAELVGLAGTKKGRGKGLAYLIRTVCGQRADSKQADPSAPAPPPPDPESAARAARIRELEDTIIDARHCGTVTKIIDEDEMTRRITIAREEIRLLTAGTGSPLEGCPPASTTGRAGKHQPTARPTGG